MAHILAINWQDLKHPESGGAEIHLEEILRRLVKRGHKIDLLCCNFPDGKKEEIVEGVNIIRRGSRPFFNYIVPGVLRSLIKKNKYDLIFEDVNKVPFYTPLYHNLPVLVIFHHLFGGSIFREINFFLGIYIYLSEKPISLFYKKNHLMVVSESTAQEIINKGVAENHVHVVHNGIDQDVYNFDTKVPKFERPTILYVGRIKKYKSIETVIDAMPAILQRLPEAKLVIVGAGDHLPNLKEHVKRKQLTDFIELEGFVPQETKVEYYRRSHLLVYPSYKEGWGLTNIEANACGTTVLASRVPGLRDSVDEGKSGLLFEYGNISEFVEKALKILTNNEYRSQLEKGALVHASKFSWDKTTDKTEELMELILSGK
jgi:glycosyltransferase involved in cell wall biosynthesis